MSLSEPGSWAKETNPKRPGGPETGDHRCRNDGKAGFHRHAEALMNKFLLFGLGGCGADCMLGMSMAESSTVH